MIQRIQTIYLALVTILASMFGFFNEYSVLLLEKYGLAGVSASLLAVLSSLLAFTSIFFFKNRKTQMHLISYNYIALILAGVIYVINDGLNEFYKDWTFYLLIISLVALALARKGVKADEELIRSADRLR